MKNEKLLKLLNSLTDASLELISITESKNVNIDKKNARKLTYDKYNKENKVNRDIKNNRQRT